MKESSVAKVVSLLWHRLSDAVRFYNDEAKRSSNPVNGEYLCYLSKKKQNQLIVFEKIASNLAGSGEQPPEPVKIRALGEYSRPLDEPSLIDIHDFALRCSVNDMVVFNSYTELAQVEPAKKILSALMELERDVFFDIQTGYIDFLAKQIAQDGLGFSTEHPEAMAIFIAS